MDRRLRSVNCTSARSRGRIVTTSNLLQDHKIVTQCDWLGARKGETWRLPSSVVCATIFLLSSIVLGHAQTLDPKADPEPTAATIRPFKMHVPDQVLIDLRHRLAETKWPDQLPGTTWEYGADIKKVRELADYWENNYDWRAQEAKINRFDQFTTEIDGQQIYFIHERSPRPDAIPLMLIHGWPGSIVEFLALIEPLTHPNDSHSPAFDVIIPSLPGFGFSGPTTTRGWGPERMAKTLVVLMDRLGYSRYGIQGGDWGSAVAQAMAYQAPTHVIGLHLNLIFVPPPNPDAVAKMSDAERKRYSYFDREESSFFFLQASEPQTLAYALTDSPAGWLAWMTAKFQLLTDNNGDFLTAVDRDTFLDQCHPLLGYRHGRLRHANLSRESARRGRSGANATPGDSCGVCGFSEGGSCPSVSLDYPDIQHSTKDGDAEGRTLCGSGTARSPA